MKADSKDSGQTVLMCRFSQVFAGTHLKVHFLVLRYFLVNIIKNYCQSAGTEVTQYNFSNRFAV